MYAILYILCYTCLTLSRLFRNIAEHNRLQSFLYSYRYYIDRDLLFKTVNIRDPFNFSKYKKAEENK